MSYRFRTEPPLWLGRVNSAVIPQEGHTFLPAPDPGDDRLYLRKTILDPHHTYNNGKSDPKVVVDRLESHFDLLTSEGIKIPGGREYFAYLEKDGDQTIVTQCAAIKGLRLDSQLSNPRRPVELPVVASYAVEGLHAYLARIENEGHDWMLQDIFSAKQYMHGRTIWDGPRSRLYLHDLDPYMLPVTDRNLQLARRCIAAINIP
jgi:hypothetical protein